MKRTQWLLRATLGAGSLVAMAQASANASPCIPADLLPGIASLGIYEGCLPAESETKVLLQAGTGQQVLGNAKNTGTQVDFNSSDSLDAKNGFSTIKGLNNTSYNDLTISVPGHSFTDLMFGAQFATGGEDENEDDSKKKNKPDFTISAFDGLVQLGSYTFGASDLKQEDDNGDLKFLVLAQEGSFITSIVLSSDWGIKQTKQFELSGLEVLRGSPSVVPLPAALPLFAAGLGVMGFLAKRRKRKAVAANAA